MRGTVDGRGPRGGCKEGCREDREGTHCLGWKGEGGKERRGGNESEVGLFQGLGRAAKVAIDLALPGTSNPPPDVDPVRNSHTFIPISAMPCGHKR